MVTVFFFFIYLYSADIGSSLFDCDVGGSILGYKIKLCMSYQFSVSLCVIQFIIITHTDARASK